MQDSWHTSTTKEVTAAVDVAIDQGLDATEAQRRLKAQGPNELQEWGGPSPLRLLWAQFSNTMVLILIAAALVSGFLGKVTETAAIGAIVVLFALLGFFQEYRAEKAMAALKRMAVPVVRVRRVPMSMSTTLSPRERRSITRENKIGCISAGLLPHMMTTSHSSRSS